MGNINSDNFYPVKFNTNDLPFSVVGMSDVMPYPSTRYKDLTADMVEKYKSNFKKVILKAVNEFKPDLIISHHLWILTSLVRKLNLNIKLIGISHGTGLRQLKKLNKFDNYVIEGCRDLDLIFALNKYQKKQISKLYDIDRDKIIVMGAGYDSTIFYKSNKAKPTNDVINVVYAGKLSYAKGVKFLIKAFEKLNKKRNEKLKLTLFGEGSGSELKEIKNLVECSKAKIELAGSVPQKKLGEVFRKSDIFCLPSFYEGLALVVIEALASGLRIVTTELPGIKEWIGKTINESGVIEYVKLPELENIDIPKKEDLEGFEKRLENSLERQINKNINKNSIRNKDFENAIKKLSWKGVFSRMEKYF